MSANSRFIILIVFKKKSHFPLSFVRKLARKQKDAIPLAAVHEVCCQPPVQCADPRSDMQFGKQTLHEDFFFINLDYPHKLAALKIVPPALPQAGDRPGLHEGPQALQGSLLLH